MARSASGAARHAVLDFVFEQGGAAARPDILCAAASQGIPKRTAERALAGLERSGDLVRVRPKSRPVVYGLARLFPCGGQLI